MADNEDDLVDYDEDEVRLEQTRKIRSGLLGVSQVGGVVLCQVIAGVGTSCVDYQPGDLMNHFQTVVTVSHL